MSDHNPFIIALTVAVSCGLAAGCTGEFDPPSRINGLRTLAMRATPPFIDPKPTASTQLDALVVGAPGGAQLCHAWGLCAFVVNREGVYKCADPALTVALSTEATAEINSASLGQLLAGAQKFAKGQADAALTSTNSGTKTAAAFDVTVQYAVAEKSVFENGCPPDITTFLAIGCSDRQRCVLGQKTLKLAAADRSNPVLSQLVIERNDKAVTLTPQWTASSKTALFSWFATAGEYAKQRSYEDVPENTLTLDDTATTEPTEVWAVVRDGRGGVSWKSATL